MSDHDHAGVRFPPPFIYLGMLLTGLAIGGAVGDRGFGLGFDSRAAIGAVLGLAGVAVGVAAAIGFRRAGTSVKPWEASTAIVDTGIYAWTRNPMYLGMALLYAGLALLLDSVAALALLPVVLVIIHTQVIRREERYLEHKFGEPYRSYMQRVRRWI